MLTRKTYEMVAAQVHLAKDCTSGFSDEYNAGRNGALETLANFLAIQFARDNPMFKRDKFMKACGFRHVQSKNLH